MDPRPHILIVQGDLQSLDDHGAAIVRSGDFQVTVVADGTEMQRLLSFGKVDVLIVDITRPCSDAASCWRQPCSAGSPPVILLAAPGCEPGAIDALQAGAADYINKPFSGRELLARVRGLLRRSREARATAEAADSSAQTE